MPLPQTRGSDQRSNALARYRSASPDSDVKSHSDTWPKFGTLGRPEARDVLLAVNDGEFLEMLGAFQESGGLATAPERQSGEDAQVLSFLGQTISLSGLICFTWRGSHWLPLFQFEPVGLTIRSGPQRVMAELATVMPGAELPLWFGRPHAMLDGRRPVNVVLEDTQATLAAARLDRFIALG